MDTATIARFARQIALPEIGPEGQERICGARVLVAGGDLTAEVAALYLRAAGAGTVTEIGDLPGDAAGWAAALEGADLVIRSGWDDDPMVPVVRRLGVAAVVVRARAQAVDLLAFPARAPDPDVTVDVPARRLPHTDGPTSVVAGTLAAAEGLWLLVQGRPRWLHMSLPLIPNGVPFTRELGTP